MFQKMAVLWWLDAWSDGIRKGLCPSKATSCRYEKLPTLEVRSLEIAAEQQLSASGIQKVSFSYQSTKYPTFNGFHILKWPQICPAPLCFENKHLRCLQEVRIHSENQDK